ncbi:MAG: hypothetical protein HRT90_06180 [Candidatus Margulisbacteria bacterium]|nr:hypothetical protein [Candidatus Margulisiibacteriota bacterium]
MSGAGISHRNNQLRKIISNSPLVVYGIEITKVITDLIMSFLERKELVRLSLVPSLIKPFAKRAAINSIKNKYKQLGIKIDKSEEEIDWLQEYNKANLIVENFKKNRGCLDIGVNDVVNKTSIAQEKMLHIAMFSPYTGYSRDGLHLATCLLILDADPNVTNSNGDTALYLFCKYFPSVSYTDFSSTPACMIIEALLLGGANINATNKDGNTALHTICSRASFYNRHYRDSMNIIGLLIKFGADVTKRSGKGDSAIDLLNNNPHLLDEDIEVVRDLLAKQS